MHRVPPGFGRVVAAMLVALPRRVLAGGVRGYRLLLKPWLGNACRFEPSCSQYALDALERHGAAAGTLLATGRLLRCHPWCDGGLDPVPADLRDAPPLRGLFTRLGLRDGAEPPASPPAPSSSQTLRDPR